MAMRPPKSKDEKKSYYERKTWFLVKPNEPAELISFGWGTTYINDSPKLSASGILNQMNAIQFSPMVNPAQVMGLSGSSGNYAKPQSRIRADRTTLYKVKEGSLVHCGSANDTYNDSRKNFQRNGLRIAVRETRPAYDRDNNDSFVLLDYFIVDDRGNHVDTCSGCFFESDIDFGGTGTKKEEPAKEIDVKQLDKVVLKADVKEEIIAVLQQHKHAATIFDDWGLGDVIEYGRGMTFLFHGKPGTGKTWAANCMAKAMGVNLLTIGSAEIQTSEPGGANRNIINAFKAAKEKNDVLFLDECDSLITNRTHVGMIIGSEINTLLTEIEKFEGVVILATNRIGSLDEALARRISLIVEFPAPTQAERADIWKRMLPEKMPLHKDVSIEDLSSFALTGGQIKNVVLQAARLALAGGGKKVEKSHFEKAIIRIQNSHDLFGKEDHYIQVKKDTISSK